MRKKPSIGASIYPVRIIGYFFCGISVYLARDLGSVQTNQAIWLALVLLAFLPHLAYAQFARREVRDAELLNLLVDMLVIGFIVNLVFFKPAVALCYLIANSATNYAVRGIKFVIKGLAAFTVGVVLSVLLLGATYDPETQWFELIPAFVYLILATHYIGYISYVRGVSLMRARKQAEELAHLDGLTGIPNRRSFDSAMDQEWNRALRDGSNLSLVLLDIDHFKAYNDRYGHPVGDDCLIQVAAEISGQVSRPGDQVARNGGEEFAVLLPGSDLEGARTVAESIRSGIQALQIEHCGSETESVVTVSLGLATRVPSEELSPRGLILAADQALYRAKAEGRNRVCIDGEGIGEEPR